MEKINTLAECILAAERAKTLGLTQESISLAVNASQSQVSRVLSGRVKKYAGLAERVCIYVNSQSSVFSNDTLSLNDELISAIASVWDGSADQARLLANLIRAAGALNYSQGIRRLKP